MKKVGIIGCGWLGIRLAKHLSTEHQIYCTTRSIEKLEKFQQLGFKPFLVDFSKTISEKWNILGELDVLVVTIPFSRRNTNEELHQQFLELAKFTSAFDKQMFFTSATGIYPNKAGNYVETHSKNLNPQLDFIEQLFVQEFPQVNRLRLGGLMGDNRQLKNYLPLKNIEQAVNHIHYQDICRVIRLMIKQNSTKKLYNVVAPIHPTKQEVVNSQWNEKASNLNSDKMQRIISSEKLIKEQNFNFQFPNPVLF